MQSKIANNNMKKKILSILLCFCMMLSLLSGITVPVAAATAIPVGAFGDGQNGSYEAPYQISSTGQFAYLDSSYGTHYFILKNNLNFYGNTTGVSQLTSYLEGSGYTISNYAGTLIGNNMGGTLTNIVIDSPATYVPTTSGKNIVKYNGDINQPSYQQEFGFICATNQGTINCVQVKNATIKLYNEVGGGSWGVDWFDSKIYNRMSFITALNSTGGNIRNCTVSDCNVEASTVMAQFGGLAAVIEGGTISGCAVIGLKFKATGNVSQFSTYFENSIAKGVEAYDAGIMVGVMTRGIVSNTLVDEVSCLKKDGNTDNVDTNLRLIGGSVKKSDVIGVVKTLQYTVGNSDGMDNVYTDNIRKVVTISIPDFNTFIANNYPHNGSYQDRYLDRGTKRPYLPIGYTPYLGQASKVQVKYWDRTELSSPGDIITLPLYEQSIQYMGAEHNDTYYDTFVDRYNVTYTNGGAAYGANPKVAGTKITVPSQSISIGFATEKIPYVVLDTATQMGNMYSPHFLLTTTRDDNDPNYYTADINTAFPNLNTQLQAQVKSVYKNASGDTVTDVNTAPYGIYTVSFDASGMTYPKQLKNPTVTALLWHTGPLTSEQAALNNAYNSYNGNSVSAVIPVLEAAKKVDSSLTYEVWYESTDTTTYSLTQEAPKNVGTYNVYVKNLKAHKGNSYAASWAETESLLLGTMSIGNTGATVSLDNVLQTNDFSIHYTKDGQEQTAAMSYGSINTSAVPKGSTVELYYKTARILTEENFDPDKLYTYDLASLTVYSALDSGLVFGGIAAVSSLSNVSEKDMVLRYFIKRGTKLSEVLTNEPSVSMYSNETGGTKNVPMNFKGWVDASDPSKTVSNDAVIGTDVTAVAAGYSNERWSNLAVGETYYIYSGNIGTDLGSKQNFTPFVYGGTIGSRRDKWDYSYENVTACDPIAREMFISKEVYPYAWEFFNTFTSNRGLIVNSKTCDNTMGYGQYYRLPTAGTYNAGSTTSSAVFTNSMGGSGFYQTNQPWNDRTQLYTKLGSAAAVINEKGEYCWDKYYNSKNADSCYSAPSGAPTKNIVDSYTQYGVRLVMELGSSITDPGQIHVVKLELGDCAADANLTSMNCVFTTAGTNSYTISARPSQATDSLVGFTTEPNGKGTYYVLGSAIPASVTTLYAAKWQALSEADCIAKGLDTKYVGYYPLYTPDDFARASTLVDTSKPSANFLVMNDIDFENAISKPIGNGRPYTGTLDGNFHVLRNVNITSSGNTGLVGTAGFMAVVKCIGIESGSITLDHSYGVTDAVGAGAIIGGLQYYDRITASIDRCWAGTGVTVQTAGAYIGGLCGYGFRDSSSVTLKCNITDSYFLGTLNGGNADYRYLIVSGGSVSKMPNSVTNSFAVNTQRVKDIGGVLSNTFYSTLSSWGDAYANASAEQFASGEVAWRLNNNRGIWSQGADYPMLADSTHKPTYRVTFSGTGITTVYAYSNSNGNVAIPASVAERALTYNSATFTASTKVTSDITVTVGAATTRTDAPAFVGATYTMQGTAPKTVIFTLAAEPAPDTNYYLYSTETGGTLMGTVVRNGTTLTVTLSSAPTAESTTFYIAAQKGTKAESTRAAVICNLKPQPEFNSTISNVTATYGDKAIAWTNTLKTGDGTVTFKSNNANVAEVDSTGALNIGNAGTITITVSVAEGTVNRAATYTYTVTVNPKNVSESRAATSQNVIEGNGTFTEPTGFDGITGTLTYSCGTVTGGSYSSVVNYLKTLTRGDTATINYTYTANGNYTGTISGTINATVIGLGFTGDGLTVTAAPAYGHMWSDILKLDGSKYSAKLSDETISGNYRVQVKSGEAAFADITGTAIPAAGSYDYQVLFTSTDNAFTDIVVTSGSVVVAQRVVELIWSNTSLTYNGSVQAPTAEISNRVGADVVSVTVTGGKTGVGSGYNATAESLEGAAKDNYKLPDPEPVQSFSIVPTTSTLSWGDNTAQSTMYTGNEAAITAPTVTLMNGETYNGTISYSYKAQGSTEEYTSGLPADAGTWLVKAHMTESGNYGAANSTDMTLTITPAPLTVTGVTSMDRTYNGSTAVTVSGGTLSTVLNNDDVTLITTGATGAIYDAKAGPGKSVTVTGYVLSGTKSANYTLTQPTDVTVNISKATIMVTANDKKIIRGTALPTAYTPRYDGFVGSDTKEMVIKTDAELSCSAIDSNTVGFYPITPSGGEFNANYDENYQFSYTKGTLSIVEKTLVTITGLSAPTGRIYNGSAVANSDFGTPVYSPNWNGTPTYTYFSSESVSGSPLSMAPKDIGTYTVRVSIPNDDPAYTGYADITFTIGKASVDSATVTLDSSNFSYNGGSQVPTAMVKIGEAVLDASQYDITYSNSDSGVGNTVNAGIVTVTVTAKADSNYTGSATSTYTINPAVPAITWSEEDKVQNVKYGDAVEIVAPAVTLVNNEIFGGTITYKYKALASETYKVGLPTSAGKYLVKAHIDAMGNYAAADSTDMTLTIEGPPEKTDAEKVEADKAVLTIGFALGDSADKVTQNISLTVTGAVYGSKITWLSDNQTVISNSGVVTRPSYASGDAGVTVTASVYSNGVSDTKEFTLKVLKLAQITHEVTFKDWDEKVLNTQTVNEGSGATAPGNPSREGFTFIGWDKDFSSVFSELTVMAQYNVVNPAATDAEKVAADKAVLTIGFAPGDSVDKVTQNLSLTVTGAVYGSKITWISSNPAVISVSGVVIRPAYASGDAGVTVTASVYSNGVTDIKAFSLKVLKLAQPTYEVTFKDWDGKVLNTQTVNEGSGATTPANPSRAGYTFTGWDIAFSNVTSNLTVTAQYKKNESGGSGDSSSGGGIITPTTEAVKTYQAAVSENGAATTNVPVKVNKDTGSAVIDVDSDQGGIVKGGGTVAITMPAIPDIAVYSINIPVPYLSTADASGKFTFKSDTGNIIIPSNMLTGTDGEKGQKAQISISQGDKSVLSDEVKAAIGDRPIIQLTITIDEKQIAWNNPDAPVTVSIPYKPTPYELENPESIVVWYIDGSGKAVSVPNGHYDAATGSVTFTTTHFSDYAVAYNKVSFSDVSSEAWYGRAVSYIAARGITTGTGNGCYNHEASITRGEFIVMLMRAYGIKPDTNTADNFSDAGNMYYTGYLAAAKRLGISKGIGNKMFAPDMEITRQEMFTLLYNALKKINKLPKGNTGKQLANYNDAEQVASWAKEALALFSEAGTINGNGNKLLPTETTTRAEMAQVLYNLMKR